MEQSYAMEKSKEVYKLSRSFKNICRVMQKLLYSKRWRLGHLLGILKGIKQAEEAHLLRIFLIISEFENWYPHKGEENDDLEKLCTWFKQFETELEAFIAKSWRYKTGNRIFSFLEIVLKRKKSRDPVKYILKELKNKNRLLKQIKKEYDREKRNSQRQIKKLKVHLYRYGSSERAIFELQNMLRNHDNFYARKMAAWELAVWYANDNTETEAEQSLKMLSIAMDGEKELHSLHRAAVIEAECYERLGDRDNAVKAILRALNQGQGADLYLAMANLEKGADKLLWINKALALSGLCKISFDEESNLPLYDCLRPGPENYKQGKRNEAPLVSIIVPAYNAEQVIETALKSLLSQTWNSLEILVVDDCSKDNTVEIVEKFMQKDRRIKLLRAEVNCGPYVARNLALKIATGKFVTCHDADDWSHPEKIEKQVLHLIENPSVIGNTSQLARATSEVSFHRRNKPGYFIKSNLSSFMFRRQPVVEKAGYWDSVRLSADGEFVRRIKKLFGERALVHLLTGPLSFPRQEDASLTGDKYFGYHGYFMGARYEYFESYSFYHEAGGNLRYDFPQGKRPFAVPEPLCPKWENVISRRHFDVIIVSDFRLPGGTNSSNAEEIKVHKKMGLRTGLVQMSRYEMSPWKKRNSKIMQLLDGTQVQMLVYGEEVTCELLILRYPPLLSNKERFIPDIKAGEIRVIVNQTPFRDYRENALRLYDIRDCEKQLREYFGHSGTWHPNSPLIRRALVDHHFEELETVILAEEDWLNIINLSDWQRPERSWRGGKPKIGRHSRDSDVKWPASKEELLAVYPNFDDFEVHILGGANTAIELLGNLPKNWYVHEFGAMHPKDFLSSLDVFVYYTHPDWIEAFARVILEAMAVGVPVILPAGYRPLFREAAIYAAPNEVKDAINRLMGDEEMYKRQVIKAWAYLENHFSYKMHAKRLMKYGGPNLREKVEIRMKKDSLINNNI